MSGRCDRRCAEWLEARLRRLLPTHYFHPVFTVPHELNPLVYCNRKTCYDIPVPEALGRHARPIPRARS